MTEYFYTMVSVERGAMEVAWTDREMMVADRENALRDPDKTNVSELNERAIYATRGSA